MKYFKGNIFYAFVITSLLLALTGIQPAHASVFLVNSFADTSGACSTTGTGACSLRDAMIYADAHGGGVITFAENFIITLGSQQLPTVNTTITINGNGAANTVVQASPCDPITLPGGCTPSTHRIFEVGTGSLTLNNLTVEFGDCPVITSTCDDVFGTGGGALNYGGTLTVTNSTFFHNKGDAGGGIANNTGTLNVTNSIFSGNAGSNGGGIFIAGATEAVTDSTFSDNSAFNGGGIYNVANILTVKNSTFSSNHVTNLGGGISNINTLAVTNSTFSGNTAANGGGGIENYSGTFTLTNNTFSANSASLTGGGLENRAQLYMTNNIIANSIHGDCVNTSAFVFANSHNLIMDGSCSSPSDLSGDPKLGALASNIGPTQTMALQPGSPAIDAGDTTACASSPVSSTDQRGLKRLVDAACDIGAYEMLFTDVPDNYWAASWIDHLYGDGVTGGCSSNPLKYCPANAVTRAQMAIFLLRGKYGSGYVPTHEKGLGPFNDVPNGSFAADWINALASEGITSGCGNNNYCPNQVVTRAQMAIFLVRAKYGTAFVPPPATGIFTDVPVGSFGASFIEQLVADGITNGCTATTYCPSSTVKRDSMAVFLIRAFNLP